MNLSSVYAFGCIWWTFLGVLSVGYIKKYPANVRAYLSPAGLYDQLYDF